ncbi:JmjC domain-containing protein [Streptomyces sp. SM14]|uniref:JmjC domain-containing protein n=1 Tax=Streptomyces sp. SM14 TaxID=1736045 RepID=UPI000CD5B157|nr:cupin domain-containing protein [Streptomyces sp. SM14]
MSVLNRTVEPAVLPSPRADDSWAAFWDTFATEHWDRGPVVVRGLTRPPFTGPETFEAAAAACSGPERAALALPQLTVGRDQQHDPEAALPRADDRSLDGYERRMASQLGGERYALVLSRFHTHAFPLWRRQTEFFAPLWRRTGRPLGGTITTMFHGTYESSPVGVHKDRFATFMFVLRGSKRMRMWPARPWTENVSTMPDYDAHRDGSLVIEASAGDLVYWPSSYYHVGESAGSGTASTSVNVGVAREEHQAEFDLVRFLDGHEAQPLPVPPSPPTDPPRPLLTAGGTDGVLGVPAELAAALGRLRDATGPGAVRRRVAGLSVQECTSGGFAPVPPPATGLPAPALTARVRAVTPVVWTECDGVRLYSAHGHVAVTTLPGTALATLLDRLGGGSPRRAAEVLHGLPAEAGDVLARLATFRALDTRPAGR